MCQMKWIKMVKLTLFIQISQKCSIYCPHYSSRQIKFYWIAQIQSFNYSLHNIHKWTITICSLKSKFYSALFRVSQETKLGFFLLFINDLSLSLIVIIYYFLMISRFSVLSLWGFTIANCVAVWQVCKK